MLLLACIPSRQTTAHPPLFTIHTNPLHRRRLCVWSRPVAVARSRPCLVTSKQAIAQFRVVIALIERRRALRTAQHAHTPRGGRQQVRTVSGSLVVQARCTRVFVGVCLFWAAPPCLSISTPPNQRSNLIVDTYCARIARRTTVQSPPLAALSPQPLTPSPHHPRCPAQIDPATIDFERPIHR